MLTSFLKNLFQVYFGYIECEDGESVIEINTEK